MFENNISFIPCKEYSLGAKYETLRDKDIKIVVSKLTQYKFQYISIVETLRVLFDRHDFLEIYFDLSKSHINNMRW